MPPRVDFKSQRLFVDAGLHEGAAVALLPEHAHYLLTVLRMETGDGLLVFNGRDGEWRATVERRSKRDGALIIGTQTRPQPGQGTVSLLFSPIRKERMHFLVEKAVEMGASRLMPVITEHTQSPKVRLDKLRATVVEAAEQCGVLNVPALDEVTPLPDALKVVEDDRRTLIFCDEQAELIDPSTVLEDLRGRPIAVLIGPEGGFSPAEQATLTALSFSRTIALGPRILRAETAAIAALTMVQSVAGDWHTRLTTAQDRADEVRN